MSDPIIKLVITGVLFLHGLAHIGPIVVYIWLRYRPGGTTGGWLAARSWLLPSMPPTLAALLASGFWAVSLIGFIGAALSFWGILLPGEIWRQLAIGSAVVSIFGIALFFRTWPMFNTLAALGVNIVVLITQLWSSWPPQDMFGN
jgi:hypothetical protein